ncbi:unnamed protein product [Didymodactylos carnosus]|uniref:RBR-type E3 ubiquitin transferase n=1 Tax=Didymodactylos carnosus TaxID=1234261 RepID=A0A813RI88_9BILA|nr:unnamed protein product [Didymodactylos carnosus]CAF0786328.1 unnamed protein product [Didymodactylos carnosus]CAF3564742.1 unnamed protein product [Didymodactylos carnosus]CAF3568531.1 unnamed protein product [Didymodactylos carnosus]
MEFSKNPPEEQIEELAVLQSIFDKDFQQFDLRNFEVVIRFDLVLSPITIRLQSRSHVIHHFPPLNLVIQYPQDYPKYHPPIFILLHNFLSKTQLTILCFQLDRIWQQQSPMNVIVYKWIEFLKDESMNLLCNRELVLTDLTTIDESSNDSRAVTTYDNQYAKRIFEQLLEYNREQNHLIFQHSVHLCEICLEQYMGDKCVQFQKCSHYYCLQCLNQYAKEHMNTGTINCPHSECLETLLPSEVRRILNDTKLYEKYERFQFEKGLEKLNDIVWCPRCQKPVSFDVDSSLAICLQCQFTFCLKCRDVWHPQIECPKTLQIKNLKVKSKNNKIHQDQEMTIYKEILSAEIIEVNTKPCPNCNIRIEKNGGCNHMICTKCKIHFCWTCGWHNFILTGHTCAPNKFYGRDAASNFHLQEQVLSLHDNEIREIMEQYDTDKPSVIGTTLSSRIKMCPNCQKLHVKIGTHNMLSCQQCNRSFCFLCGEPCFGKYHFSPYGCQEHTTHTNIFSDKTESIA